MQRYFSILAATVALLLSACHSLDYSDVAASAETRVPDAARPFGFASFGLDDITSGLESGASGGPDVEAPALDRLMIRTAELQLDVARADDAVARCEALIAARGGYISRRDGASLVCRVPVAHFDAVLVELRSYGRVLRDVVQALDVTEQHRDLAIRLDNAKRSRDRLLELLARADKVEDLLKIESELRRLTEEIETMTAELQSLESRIALSTITVSFAMTTRSDQPVRRRPSRFGWINSVGAEHVLRRF